MKVAYFTGGTVGAGHLVRGLAVGRGLARAGFHGEYRMFGPRLAFAAARRENYVNVEVQSDHTLLDRNLAQASGLARELQSFAPDLLVVDMFWAPLRWLLRSLPCESWLLVRICPPQWLIGLPALPFEPELYDRIVAIEPAAAPAVRDRIDPVVICNPQECRPREALRERLGIAADRWLEVVLHAGERGESEELIRAAGEDAVVLDLFDPGAPFPAAEWLAGADRIVAGAGYNSFWEAHGLGHAERTEWRAFRRSIDDQALRLATGRGPAPRENGADTLARWILEGGRS